MYRVFNMGIGLILIVSLAVVDRVLARVDELGDQGYRIGEIVPARSEGVVEYAG
jgi:phosphoribosylaminoimidazole (AIR) synthetase